MTLIKLEQIDALLPFLEMFEKAGFSTGQWQTKEGQLPWFNFDEIVSKFVKVLYDNNWITPQFDWLQWQDSANQYIEFPERIMSADTSTIQKLLITHVRADRFNEGHLATMLENGHIIALLRRLHAIRAEMA